MREKQQAHAAARKGPGWSQWWHIMEKRGPHAPVQFLTKSSTAVGGSRPKSPTPKPSMLLTGGFPANADTNPTLDAPDAQAILAAAAAATSTSSVPRSRTPSPTPPSSSASTPERRNKRRSVLALRSPSSSPAPSSRQQQPPQHPLSHPTSSSTSSTGAAIGLLLGPRRRTLGFDEFAKRLDRILLLAGIPGPGFLYTHFCDAEKERDRHLTFRPRINPRSAELVAGRWAARSRAEVFDLLHAEGALKVQRLEEARREKVSHLLDECTFQPFLFTYRDGQPPRYHYPDAVWVQQQVAASPRSRSAFAVQRRGQFDAPRARSTPPVRLAGKGVYNKEHTPTHHWPKPVVRDACM